MRRPLRLAVWGVVALALAAAASLIRIDTDLGRFISAAEANPQLDLALALQQGAASRLVLIALQAPTRPEAAAASRRVVAALRASGLFATLHNGDPALFAAELQPLLPYRYGLSDRVDAATFSEQGLRASLLRAQQMLGDARGWAVSQLLPLDPTLETLHIAEQWAGGQRLPMHHGVWFTVGGNEALIIGATRAAGEDVSAQRAVEAAIVQAAAPAQVRFTGLGLLAAEARRATRSRVEMLGWASIFVVALILYLGYRRLLPVMLSLLPVAFGLGAGVAATMAVFGDVHLLAVAFACILIGEASDYPSFLLTQARPGVAIGAEAARVAPTLRLAVLTSAAAFTVLLLAQFRGLQQLGLLCSVGVLTAGAAARWLVPDCFNPLQAVTWNPPRLAQTAPGLLVTAGAQRTPSRIVQLALVLLALAALATVRPLWDDGIAAINPLPPGRIAADRALRTEAGLAVEQSVLVFTGADEEAVLQAQEAWLPELRRLQQQGRLQGFDLAARYLPSRKLQRERLATLPADSELAARLERAAATTAFNVEAFAPFLDSTSRSQPLMPQLVPDGMFRQRIDSLLLRVNGKVVGLVPVSGISAPDDLTSSARAASAAFGVQATWFEPRAGVTSLLSSVRERLMALLLVCMAAVYAVVAFDRRSAIGAARVVVPVVTSLVLTAAIARLALGPLNAFHLVALLLLLGVVTNYSLFIDAAQRGPGQHDQQAHTLFSLAVASATTLAVFGALAVSGIRIVESVGQTVVIGIIAGLAWLIADARLRARLVSTDH